MQESISIAEFRAHGSTGGKRAWKGKTKAERSAIMRERARVGWITRKLFSMGPPARKVSVQAARKVVKAR